MRMVPPKRARLGGMPGVQLDYFTLDGGWDQVTPPLQIKPGFCRDAENYEIGINGGYRRIDGYERFDGRTAPSAAIYYVIPCTITGSISAGNTVTGSVTGATGYVIAVEASAVVITAKSGDFNGTENLNVGGSPQATTTGVQVRDGASSNDLHWQYKKLAGDYYRSLITAVPGLGPILGVWYYNGTVYAFRNHTDGLSAKMWKSSASGWAAVTTGVTLNPGGRYEFCSYNFGSGLKMYGCDGANKAFQFDGTTYTQITTGMTTDTPNRIAAHANHLFLAFDNSIQHSPVGNPTGTWTPVLGAGEINAGETVTNFMPMPGDSSGAALVIFTRNTTQILYGTTSANWKRVILEPEAGAIPYTAQYIGDCFVFDDRGITSLATTDKYGNFASASVSSLVRKYIIENKARVIASGVSRDKNQYRIFFSGGRALYMTLGHGFMPVLLPHSLSCYTSTENADGNEVAFAGGDDGYVYSMDTGNNFDGQSIDAYIGMVFNHSKSPRTKKFYRKAIIEVSGEGSADFWMSADLSYGNPDLEQIQASQLTAALSSGNWDSGVWDVGVWDGRILAPSEFELSGTAENISLRFAQSTNYQQPLTFYGALIHYTPRRLLR